MEMFFWSFRPRKSFPKGGDSTDDANDTVGYWIFDAPCGYWRNRTGPLLVAVVRGFSCGKVTHLQKTMTYSCKEQIDGR